MRKTTFKDIAKTILQAVKNGICITIAADCPGIFDLPTLKFRLTKGMLQSEFIVCMDLTSGEQQILLERLNNDLRRRCCELAGCLQPEEEALIDEIGGDEGNG